MYNYRGDTVTHLSTSQLRKDFAEALNRVAYGGERIIIRRRGKDLVAMVTMQEYELLRKFEDRLDNLAADKALKEKGTIPLKEIKQKQGVKKARIRGKCISG